jgi:hypothetical protein
VPGAGRRGLVVEADPRPAPARTLLLTVPPPRAWHKHARRGGLRCARR